MAQTTDYSKYDYKANPELFNEEELRTITQLNHDGVTVYYAPIVIEHRDQFQSLNITERQCRTWRVGTERLLVHPSPCNEQTFRYLINEMRTTHRQAYRASRCLVEGKSGKMIRCADTNHCTTCPYDRKPEDRTPGAISWDELISSGYEPESTEHSCDPAFTHLVYAELLEWMEREDPAIAEVFHLKEHDGLPVADIAQQLDVSPRRVYYLLQKAEAIRAKYNNA